MNKIRARLLYASWRDGLIIFGLFTFLVVWFIHIDAFGYVIHFAETHKSWELEEFLTALMLLPIAMAIYSARRVREYYRELHYRVEAEQQAKAMALHDPLTGLPNRRNINQRMEKAFATADESPLSLLLVDLNRFKSINDLQGHLAGDELLIEVANRLRGSVGADAVVSRLGGDEFLILIQNTPLGDDLITRIEAISESFIEPCTIEGSPVSVGASIGVTVVDSADILPETALAQADAAMYRCKAQGRNGFRFFEAGMETAAFRRAQIEAELRKAIDNDEVEPYYQPLVCLETGEVLGFEVLARWKLHDGNVRMPDEFIAVAEQTGMIDALYYSILRQAAQAVRHWPPEMHFAVNLSPRQFDDEWLVEKTLAILSEAGIAPGRLEIEITENALVEDLEQAKHIIKAFKSQGIQISLDDFGTGYSSLRHLSELQFDKLKIDRSFIHDIEKNEASQTIVRTITSMAHHLGLKVTCEGLETDGNATQVIDFGCDIGQGYLYGRPAPTTDAAAGGDPSKPNHGERAA